MNCECFYLVKEGTIEAARELAAQINDTAERKDMELYTVCISQTVQDFRASGDYDGLGNHFRVPAGSWLVFAQGKLHCMYHVRPRGAKRGFPVDIYDNFASYVHDVEET